MGIPLRIQPFFIFAAALIGWLSSRSIELTLIWMGVIFVSVLVHELGHALTAKYFGQHAMIILTAWGGLTRRSGKKITRTQDFIIVLLGPAFGFLLGLGAYYLIEVLNPKGLLHYVLQITYFANFFWTFVNLIPIQPLDGGRLLGIVLDSLFGFKGIQATYFLSMFLCVAAGVIFFSLGSMIGGILFFLLCFENFRNFMTSLGMSDKDQDTDLWKEMRHGEALLHQGALDESSSILKKVIAKSKKGLIHLTALETLSEAMKRQGKPEEAYQLLLPLKFKLNIRALKQFQELAYLTKHYEMAVETGEKIYNEEPDLKTALLNALSFGGMKKGKEAVFWLNSVLTYDISINSLMDDPAFQNLLSLPEVRDFVQNKN